MSGSRARIRRDAAQKKDALHALAVSASASGEQLLALHCAVWSDLMAAREAYPGADLHSLAPGLAADGDASSWIDSWRDAIRAALPHDRVARWEEALMPTPALDGPVSLPGLPSAPFGPDSTVAQAKQRLSSLRERSAAARRAHADAAAIAYHVALEDAAAFQLFLLDRSERMGDEHYMQARIVWELARAALSTTPHVQVGGVIAARRARMLWALPADEQTDGARVFDPAGS